MSIDSTRGPALDAAEATLLLARVGEVADRREMGLWLVGGAVRDLLLGRSLRDVDLAVESAAAGTLELAARFAALPGWTTEKKHARFGTVVLRTSHGIRVDVASTRREEYPAPGALPVITGTTTIEEDLARRDFTVHAMARRVGARGLTGRVLDPHGGRADLEAKKLRLLHDRSLVDDPTRAYRAVKYAVRLGFGWDRGFLESLKKARDAQAFQALSGDRMRRGLEEIFLEGDWGKALRLASDLAIFGDVLPDWKGPLFPSKKKSTDAIALALLDEQGTVDSRPKPEEVWRRLLAPLPLPDRAAIASRLTFSKALRRAADAEIP